MWTEHQRLYRQEVGDFNYKFQLVRSLEEREQNGDRANATHELVYFSTRINDDTPAESRIAAEQRFCAPLAVRMAQIIRLSANKAAIADGLPPQPPDVRIVSSLLAFPPAYLPISEFALSHNWADSFTGPVLARCWSTGIDYASDLNDLFRYRRQAGFETTYQVKAQEPIVNPAYPGPARRPLRPSDTIGLVRAPHGDGYGVSLPVRDVAARRTSFLNDAAFAAHRHFVYPLDKWPPV